MPGLLFTKPIQAHLHVSLVAVQWTFTLFVALETWLVPFEGFLVDRIGPRFMLGIGCILAGLGWIGSGYAETIYGSTSGTEWAASEPALFMEGRLGTL